MIRGWSVSAVIFTKLTVAIGLLVGEFYAAKLVVIPFLTSAIKALHGSISHLLP